MFLYPQRCRELKPDNAYEFSAYLKFPSDNVTLFSLHQMSFEHRNPQHSICNGLDSELVCYLLALAVKRRNSRYACKPYNALTVLSDLFSHGNVKDTIAFGLILCVEPVRTTLTSWCRGGRVT